MLMQMLILMLYIRSYLILVTTATPGGGILFTSWRTKENAEGTVFSKVYSKNITHKILYTPYHLIQTPTKTPSTPTKIPSRQTKTLSTINKTLSMPTKILSSPTKNLRCFVANLYTFLAYFLQAKKYVGVPKIKIMRNAYD